MVIKMIKCWLWRRGERIVARNHRRYCHCRHHRRRRRRRRRYVLRLATSGQEVAAPCTTLLFDIYSAYFTLTAVTNSWIGRVYRDVLLEVFTSPLHDGCGVLLLVVCVCFSLFSSSARVYWKTATAIMMKLSYKLSEHMVLRCCC